MTWEQEQLALIRPNYPEWDIWIVPQYIGGTAWCAKPKSSPVSTIQVYSPEHLVEAIAEQETLGTRPGGEGGELAHRFTGAGGLTYAQVRVLTS